FELRAAVPLNLVCFGHRTGDEFNRKLLDRLNQTGKLYLTHTILDGRFTLRFCVGQTNTELEHVRGAWELIQQVSRSLKTCNNNFAPLQQIRNPKKAESNKKAE